MLDCTGALVVSPNADLIRVERAIARIEEMPPSSRHRLQALLGALKEQRALILGECALALRVRRPAQQAAAAECGAAPAASCRSWPSPKQGDAA